MSWSAGSIIFSEIIQALKEHISDDEIRANIYRDIIPSFEDKDCDNLCECLDEDDAFDTAYNDTSVFAEYEEEDEEVEE